MIGTGVGYLIFAVIIRMFWSQKNAMSVFSSRCVDENFFILVVVMMINDD